MTRHVVFLRGVNLPSHNRIAMPELRELLEGAGFDDVRTYLQSGNVVLSSTSGPDAVARTCERVIASELGLEVGAVVRTRDELADVVRRDPLGEVAANPKFHQVTFLASEPDAELTDRLAAAAAAGEEFVVSGREIYSWHPNGVGRSKLAALLAGRTLGVTATSRNWKTVTSLLTMADEPGDSS